MAISDIYNGMKEVISIVQKLDNIDLQRKLVDLSSQILDMQEEIQKLRTVNCELNKNIDISSKIIRHKDTYVTLSDDKDNIIYCSNCWDTKKLLVQVKTDGDGRFICPSCNHIGYYDRNCYNIKLKELEKQNNTYKGFIN